MNSFHHGGEGAGTPGLLAVEARGVSKSFGATQALRDVRLQVEHGQAHALVGRNGAGKSTLVSILTGLQEPDTGTVSFDGAPAPAISDRDGWRSRVACVYQKSTIIPELSIAENVFLNRQHLAGPAISWRAMRAETQTLLDEWGISADATALAETLTVEQRQMVEIVRALSFGAKFLILDEPTAQLDHKAIDRLFTNLRRLKDTGVSFLFISHHLSEVFELCDAVTVFRDARYVMSSPVSEIDQAELVRAMTGEQTLLDLESGRSHVQEGEPVLVLDGLGDGVNFHDVDLSVRPGEMVGITGSGSSGRIALAESIVGLRTPTEGSVTVAGRSPRAGDVKSAISAGIGFVPRDRHHEGLVELLPIGENMTMTVPQKLGRFGVLSPGRRRVFAESMIDRLRVHASGPEQPASDLSGGNQQKVVLGRALASDPRALVLMHPTAGVDVRSKITLLEAIDETRQGGTAVVVVSDELDDLRPCDRVIVLLHGRVVRELDKGWRDEDVVAATEGMN